MRHIADFVFVLVFVSLSIVAIVRPTVIANWAKMAHQDFTGNDVSVIFIVRVIGVGTLALSAFLAVIMFRSLSQ